MFYIFNKQAFQDSFDRCQGHPGTDTPAHISSRVIKRFAKLRAFLVLDLYAPQDAQQAEAMAATQGSICRSFLTHRTFACRELTLHDENIVIRASGLPHVSSARLYLTLHIRTYHNLKILAAHGIM